MKLWHLKVGGQIHYSLFDPLQRSFSEPEQIQNHNPCLLCVSGSGLDPSQRQGVEELISAAPSRFDHAALFTVLQRSTLQHRMSDSFSCLVRHMNAAADTVGPLTDSALRLCQSDWSDPTDGAGGGGVSVVHESCSLLLFVLFKAASHSFILFQIKGKIIE